MTDAAILISMSVFALLAIHANSLRQAVIHLAVLSLLAAFLYLRFAAPELAIAEAAIGSGLVTLLYLAALKRNRIYTIGVIAGGDGDRLRDGYIRHIERSRALRELRTFFAARELEVQTVFIPDPLDEALRSPAYDLVLHETHEGIAAYTDDESSIMLELELMFRMHGTEALLHFERYAPKAGGDS